MKYGSLLGKRTDRRVLVRSDNSTSVAVVNRRGTTSKNLVGLGRELVGVCKQFDLDVAAIHIPGALNTFADRGSMYTREKDFGDWMVVKEEFDYIMDCREGVRGASDFGRGFGSGWE